MSETRTLSMYAVSAVPGPRRERGGVSVEIEPQLAILLVEDNSLDVRMFCEMAKRTRNFSCTIESVSSQTEAIHVLENAAFDLIVLDLNLPDSNGLQTYDSIHSVTEFPILILTGADDHLMAREAVSRGAQDFIVKGEVDAHSLTRAMQFAYTRSNLQRIERRLLKQEQQLEVIRCLQEALLPKYPCRSFQNAEVSAAVFPAERASGDYFDVLSLSDSEFWLIIADVSGHGLQASQSMLTARATLRTLASIYRDPLDVLRTAESLLMDDLEAGHHFVTVLVALINTSTGKVSYSSSGHVGYVSRNSGELIELQSHNVPLGITNSDWDSTKCSTLQLESGDVMLLPTDGLVETFNETGELFGLDRVVQELASVRKQSSRDIVLHLRESASMFAGSRMQEDDITLVVMKYNS